MLNNCNTLGGVETNYHKINGGAGRYNDRIFLLILARSSLNYFFLRPAQCILSIRGGFNKHLTCFFHLSSSDLRFLSQRNIFDLKGRNFIQQLKPKNLFHCRYVSCLPVFQSTFFLLYIKKCRLIFRCSVRYFD